jgi:hypothetical protein
MRKAALKNLCKEFKLPQNGNLLVLKERLAAFSADPKLWNR